MGGLGPLAALPARLESAIFDKSQRLNHFDLARRGGVGQGQPAMRFFARPPGRREPGQAVFFCVLPSNTVRFATVLPGQNRALAFLLGREGRHVAVTISGHNYTAKKASRVGGWLKNRCTAVCFRNGRQGAGQGSEERDERQGNKKTRRFRRPKKSTLAGRGVWPGTGFSALLGTRFVVKERPVSLTVAIKGPLGGLIDRPPALLALKKSRRWGILARNAAPAGRRVRRAARAPYPTQRLHASRAGAPAPLPRPNRPRFACWV